ncbi:putative hydrolase or acyltransferase of alpha/beta superfamily [Mycena sanguinolenta]|nr:putative hydrolase or acyltransferase of alpha/beta superfamily [Mycena sanguinolenta]
MAELKTATTPILEIAYYEHGSPTGWPVLLLHGFPYDIHVYDEVVPLLTAHGARVIVPYTRGYGPTRFLSPSTMRTGQQAALGSDVIALMDALSIEKAILAGFDWGGLAAWVVASLWPERLTGVVGYEVVERARQGKSFDLVFEYVMWYQHLFQSERGKDCLSRNRRELCHMLLKQWSPTWSFSDSFFEETVKSFDNPDFVDVVLHFYRHAFCSADGDPALEDLEERLAQKPKITVPMITLAGDVDPLKPGPYPDMFTGKHERRVLNVGHAVPGEAPQAFTDAILTVKEWGA